MLKTIIKQRNLNTGFANISKTTSPTSDSFLLIMSHIMFPYGGVKELLPAVVSRDVVHQQVISTVNVLKLLAFENFIVCASYEHSSHMPLDLAISSV